MCAAFGLDNKRDLSFFKVIKCRGGSPSLKTWATARRVKYGA